MVQCGEKLTLLMIGHAAKPRCFRNVRSLPVKYKSNKNAWMTSDLFMEWLLDLDTQMAEQRRNILLFADNCSAHVKAAQNIQLRQVKLIFLPPNSTSRSQPLDQGIIRSFKAHYRKRILLKIIAAFDSGKLKRGDDTGFIDLKEATFLAHSAWQAVRPEVISNCFRHAGFLLADSSDVAAPHCTSTTFHDDNEVQGLWDLACSPFGGGHKGMLCR